MAFVAAAPAVRRSVPSRAQEAGRARTAGRDRRIGPVTAGVRQPSQSPSAPLRLTRRGRWVLWSIVAALCLGIGVAGGTAVAALDSAPTRVEVHTVAPGETVWGYAREIARPGADVRDVVAEIVRINGLRSATINSGDRILLPVEG